jgi:hypothetical protein
MTQNRLFDPALRNPLKKEYYYVYIRITYYPLIEKRPQPISAPNKQHYVHGDDVLRETIFTQTSAVS